MSISPPPYSPPSYGPLPSIWTRVLDWVHRLGVADTVEDLLPGVAVTTLQDLQLGVTVAVEDLRPRAKYVQITLDAVNDFRFCEKIFDTWMTELDKVMSNSKKPDERERLLRFYTGLLKENAGRCSNETNAILQCHVRFASLMAQRIDDASVSQYNLKYDDSETTRLAKDISEAADSLSTYVAKMKENLNSFVSVLEEIQVTVKKEPSLAEQILGWLKYLFKAIARILATVCPPISALLPHSAEPKVQKLAPAVSALGKAAGEFCTADSESQEGKESESLDSVILFLKKIVPREAQIAQKNLERFDEALDIMGLESKMRAGRRVTLFGPNPTAVAEKWRNVAKQYQSVLPDNEDSGPALDRKKSCS
ncbi:hypothetical protein F5888DRAFT_297945 [Russula emetica]|nr:hypothetical protein F5888DRAFT_297945 [Russula emetica]